MEKAYKFRPLLKQTLWGGERIIPFKHLDSQMPRVGESWEISGVPGSESVVAGGESDGLSLNALVARHGARLVGAACHSKHGDEFPLLVKFIDARQDLSIQVHPDDATARRQGRTTGKTEMWYALDCAPDATLYAGLEREITPDDYRRMVAEDTITTALARHNVRQGDSFFIPAGRIHSIGAGCFLVEVQQASDVTYRIYDFGRTDANGQPRELHTDLAAEAIDYHVYPEYRVSSQELPDGGQLLVSCPLFTVSVYDICNPTTLDFTTTDSFVILVCCAGEGTIGDADGAICAIRAGETVLLPATTGRIDISGSVKLLEAHC